MAPPTPPTAEAISLRFVPEAEPRNIKQRSASDDGDPGDDGDDGDDILKQCPFDLQLLSRFSE
jgi:hypothetical protein